MGSVRNYSLSIIYSWRNKNPKGKKFECMRELDLCYNTVNKYWDQCGIEDLSPKELIERWCKINPLGRKAWCMEDTGLSFPTVNKYWVNS